MEDGCVFNAEKKITDMSVQEEENCLKNIIKRKNSKAGEYLP